jgi:predicted RNase H-like nuclease (RuvC/YqgF family)
MMVTRSVDKVDVDRLVKFLRDEAQNCPDERQSWFDAARQHMIALGDDNESLRVEIESLVETNEKGFHELNSARDEIEELQDRLEVWPTDPKTGQVDKSIRLGEDCDGIACRDETINLLDENALRLRSEIERLQSECRKAREALLGHAGGSVALSCLNRALQTNNTNGN